MDDHHDDDHLPSDLEDDFILSQPEEDSQDFEEKESERRFGPYVVKKRQKAVSQRLAKSGFKSTNLKSEPVRKTEFNLTESLSQ